MATVGKGNEPTAAATTSAVSQLLSDASSSPMDWHELGVGFALHHRTAPLLSLADTATSRFGDALIYVHNVLKDLAGRGQWAAVRHLAATIPAARRESAVALYYAGCGQLAAGDAMGALAWFDRFKQAVLPRHHEFPLGEPAFNLIFRQGVLVESPAAVRALSLAPAPNLVPLEMVGPIPDSAGDAFVAAHVMDVRYFRRFAAELCAGHLAAGLSVPLHMHVIGNDQSVPAAMAALRRDHPGLRLGFSREAPGRWNHPVYYTCARFMVMERLMDHYGRGILTSDADILLSLPMEQVYSAARAADFACFETGRDEPASAYQASIMAFSPSPAGRAFIADLVRFCAVKLDLPPALSWMLDQAALISVLTQRAADKTSFRFTPLARALNRPLATIVRNLTSAEEKLAIMSQNNAN